MVAAIQEKHTQGSSIRLPPGTTTALRLALIRRLWPPASTDRHPPARIGTRQHGSAPASTDRHSPWLSEPSPIGEDERDETVFSLKGGLEPVLRLG
ncbi:MAG: hypothetical protein C4521_08020 [Actinobacteria bacterium]|nr:MAG: hypothetical protein C4521_08020 [Actinomycetota bacterium]